MRALVGWLLIAMLSTVSNDAFGDERSAHELWTNLRQIHPFHVQLIALSDRDKLDERVLILTEPPPWAERKQIVEKLKVLFGAPQVLDVTVVRHSIGFDGWTEDVVVRLHQTAEADDIWLKAKLTDLHEQLFGTTYKAAVIRLPVKPRASRALAPPSMDVRATELKSWLIDDNPLLQPGTGGPQSPLGELLQNGQPDTYFAPTGLVVLLLPTDRAIDEYLEAIRRFALDTDAIVGAIKKKRGNRIAIVGRERTTPVLEMPPLRAEDVLRLAATKEGELGQSYERTKPLAGKLDNGLLKGKDWAPIYLSDALNNTEFGSTLNITDQLLKSWSQSGKIEYVNFPYQRPSTFPFDGGATGFLKTSRLTFNWNTVGVGAVTSIADLDIFSVLRTGSLPVSYIPDGARPEQAAIAPRVRAAEEAAYTYFSELRDPNLAHVVQLAALYQIFQAFPVTVRHDELIDRIDPGAEKELKKRTVAILSAIQEHRAAPIEKIVSGIARTLAAAGGKTSASDVANLSSKLQVVLADKIAQIEALLDALDAIATDDADELVAGALVDRPNQASVEQALTILKRAKDLLGAVEEADALALPARPAVLRALLRLAFSDQLNEIRGILGVVSDIEEARTAYVNAAAVTPVSGFIRTPSIVVSWSTESTTAVGGHNLDAVKTRVIGDQLVSRGTVVVDRSAVGVILKVHPDNVGSSNELARVYERNREASAADLKAALDSVVKEKPQIRSSQVALKFDQAATTRIERGLSVQEQGDLSIGPLGWRLAANDGAAAKAAAAADGTYQIEIVRDGSSYIVHSFVPQPPSSVRVLSAAEFPSAFEAIANRAANSNVKLDGGLMARSSSLSRTEMELIAKTLAAGGGGKGPRFPNSGASAAPEGSQPFWLRLAKRSEERGQAGDQGRDGSSEVDARRVSGHTTILELLGKIEGSTLRAKLDRPLHWAGATVTEAGPPRLVEAGEFQGLYESAWQLTVPLKQGDPTSLTARVIAFFKNRLSTQEAKDFGSVLEARAQTSGNGSSALSGFADIKEEVLKLKSSRPEALQFHLIEGADDITIVRLLSMPASIGG
jgi:hypothetical protein